MTFIRRRWPILLVLAAVAVSAVIQLWWLDRFRVGFPLDVDEAGYIAFSLSLQDGLHQTGLDGFWSAWEAQTGFGPLLPLVSLPVYELFGASPMSAFATQSVFLVLLVLSTYGVARRLAPPSYSALAAVVVAAMPIVVDYSRSYQFALPAGALFAASTYALLASEGLSRRGWSMGWGVLLGLTALTRVMMVAFIPFQLAAAVWLAWSRKSGSRRWWNLGFAVAAMLATAATWFANSWSSVLDYLTGFGYGSSSHSYGPGHSVLSTSFWTQELTDALRIDLYLPLAGLLAAALTVGLLIAMQRLRAASGRHELRSLLDRWARDDAAVVLFLLATIYLALTSTRNQGGGFRLPLYPLAVALSVLAISRLPRPSARRFLAGGLIAVSGFNVLMKADLIGDASRLATVDIPAIGDTSLINGRGYIQSFLYSSARVEPGPPTEPLPESARGWLPAHERIVSITRRAGRAENVGFIPVICVATFEPLLHPNDLVLAARRRYHQPYYAVDVRPPSVNGASYRAQLQGPLPCNELVTVFPSRAAFNQPPVDPRAVRLTARKLGFRPLRSLRLPDRRRLEIDWQPPKAAG